MADDLDSLDVSREERFVDGSVDALFARLRSERPVHYCPASEFGPYWSITRHEDIARIANCPELFSSDAARGGMTIVQHRDTLPFPMFIAMDPPEHAARRRAVAPMFRPSHLARLAEEVRAAAAETLASLPRSGAFDWMDAVAGEITLRMLAILLGFPLDDRQRLRRWSEIALAPPGAIPDRQRELLECLQSFTALRKRRAAEPPADDLISLLVHDPATARMPAAEYLGNVLLLIVGGNDTTRSLIGGSVLALGQYPEERRKLEANPELIADFVPEVIRWQSPVSHIRRTALRDVEFGGQAIRAGDKLVLWIRSANRDERLFDDADSLRIERPNARRHLGFGEGIHRCIGARLAELQLRILWEEMLRREIHPRVVAPPVRTRTNFTSGYEALSVTLEG